MDTRNSRYTLPYEKNKESINMADKISGLKKWKNNEVLTARDYVYERDTIVEEVNEQDTRLLSAEASIVTLDEEVASDQQRLTDLENDVSTLEGNRLLRDGSNAEPNIKIVDTTFKETYDDRNAVQDLDFKAAPAKGAAATSGSFNSNVGMQEYHNKVRDYTKDHIDRTDNPHGVTKQQVGLGNVDNIQQATKVEFNEHTADFNNPHQVTKAQVGLGNVTDDPQVRRDEMGVADGVATLDSNAKVPLNQLPDITKQPTLVFATTQEFNQFVTSELIEGTKAFDNEAKNAYVWDGIEWLLTSDADWENINLDWVNITNPPRNAANETLKDNNVYDVTEADAKFETITNVNAIEVRVTDVENDKEDSANIGNRTYTEENIVTNDETVTASIDALDVEVGRLESDKEDAANIGDRQYTEENIITNSETVTQSLDALDVEAGRLETDKENAANIGDRQYTEQHVVTNSETLTQSVDALDVEAKRLDNNKMELDGSNSDVLDLKFVNQDTEDALAVGELRLNNNLPEWQVSANTLHLVGRQLIERAVNRTGATLTVGKPLFISGVFTPGGGPGTDRIEVELATRSNANGVFAVASCPAGANQEGCIITRGTVKGWDTSGYQAGDKLFLTDQPGEYSVGPVDDDDEQFYVGKVIRAANDGIVLINPTRIADALFVKQSQLVTEIPILDEEGLILPQFLGDRYTDVFKGYGVFDTTDPEVPILLDFYLKDQWDLVNNQPIDPNDKAPYRSGTIYVTLNVTIDTLYRYDETSEEFVGLAPSPLGLGFTAATAYPGNEGQANRDDINLILGDYATDTNLNAHVTDTNNPHVVTATQVGLGNVDNTADLDKPISTATQTALDLKADDSSLQAHVTDTTNPHSVTATQVGLGNVLDYSVASQAEAEAGTANDKYMTPLRTAQAIQELAPDPEIATQQEAEAGTINDKFMTPLRTTQLINQATIDGGEF